MDPLPTDAVLDEFASELQRLRTATYQGWDPAHLVVATVDGDGTIVKVRFVRPVGRYNPSVVGEAVQAAVSAAQQRVADAFAAFAELAQRADSP
jgi:hypothetical protein